MLSGGGTLRPTLKRVMSAATTNSTLVRAGVGILTGVHLQNTSAAIKVFKFYDKATPPTVGTDVPVLTMPMAASGRVDFDGASIPFVNGITYAITGLVVDTDATAVAVNDVVGGILYL